MKLRLAILLFSCVGFASSCASKSDGSKEPRERSFWDALFGPDSYTSEFDRNTQRESVLSEFEPVMTVHATDWNQDMRNAYVQEMARQYRYTDEAEKALALEQLAEDQTYFVFIVSASTREPEWNEFDRKNSMWRITLESADGKIQVDPERIEVVSLKDEKAKYFYKWMSQFTRTYKVRFPKQSLRSVSPKKLHISGARGYVTFNWK